MSSTVQSKIRIYELAKELKREPKQIIEDARRAGVDVSVPSNTVPKEVAEKIRNKYYPKKETAPARAIKLVKGPIKPIESAPTAPALEDAADVTVAEQPATPAVLRHSEFPPDIAPRQGTVWKKWGDHSNLPTDSLAIRETPSFLS